MNIIHKATITDHIDFDDKLIDEVLHNLNEDGFDLALEDLYLNYTAECTKVYIKK
ncbi:MAG: hypothetical protein GY853_16895 [PVC group bacterium]|nr:hypothetical protein [PVC group bacterium]